MSVFRSSFRPRGCGPALKVGRTVILTQTSCGGQHINRCGLGKVERADPGALQRLRLRVGFRRLEFEGGTRSSAVAEPMADRPDGLLERAPRKIGPEARFHPRSRQAGFTLVETLLALALLTALLLALNVFLFSMSELWGRNRQQRLFDQHVRAVTRYLGELVQRGALEVEAGRELRLAAPAAGGGEPQLTFDLAAGDRLLPWPGAPLPDVECALSVPSGRGLVLSWHSRWETGFKSTPPRTLVVSPMVTRLDYLYFDEAAQAWQAPVSSPRREQDRWALPARLRLHFQHDRFTADTVVTIPPRLAALPAF